MISPSEMLKRAGVCGRLVPFFKAVLIYSVVGSEGGGGGARRGMRAAAKAAPALCLAAVVWAQRSQGRRRELCASLAIGLLLSAAGDALLEWPDGFEPGMAAFACAQAAYWRAWGKQGHITLRVVLAACAVAFGAWMSAPGHLALLVPLYSLGLSLASGRGIARVDLGSGCWQRTAGAIGSALFLVSDALLGYAMFVSPLPHRTLLVMSTYYMAQLGIAITAFEPEAKYVK